MKGTDIIPYAPGALGFPMHSEFQSQACRASMRTAVDQHRSREVVEHRVELDVDVRLSFSKRRRADTPRSADVLGTFS